MTRAALLLLALACASCGGAVATIQTVGEAEHIVGVVAATRGPVVPRVGDRCAIDVFHTDHDVYACRLQVRCSGDQLYGHADGGYLQCARDRGRFLAAEDRRGTREDGDSRLRADLALGRVWITDDDPDVVIEIAVEPLP